MDVSDAALLQAVRGLLKVFSGRTDDCIRLTPKQAEQLLELAEGHGGNGRRSGFKPRVIPGSSPGAPTKPAVGQR